jgi:uncharacterized protein (UPF0332 family)
LAPFVDFVESVCVALPWHVRPREFCTVAGVFAARGEAAASRSAISRAYYSLFHVVRDFLVAHQVKLPKNKPESHKLIFRLLFNCGNEDLKLVASALNDLRGQRNDADYEMNNRDVELPSTARAAVERAQREISRFDAFIQTQTKIASVVQAIKLHATSVEKIS